MKVAIWGYCNGKNLGDLWILENMKKRFPFIIPIFINSTNFENYDFLIIGGGGLLNGPLLRKPFDDNIKCKYGTIGLSGEFPILEYNKLSKFINNSLFFGIRDNVDIFKGDLLNKKIEDSADCTFLYPLKTLPLINYKIRNIKLIWRDPYNLMKWDKIMHHKDDGFVLNACFSDYLGEIPFNNNIKCQQYYKEILSKYGEVKLDDYVVNSVSLDTLSSRFDNIDIIVSILSWYNCWDPIRYTYNWIRYIS